MDCTKTFGSQVLQEKHIKGFHTWIPTKCTHEDCPSPEQLFKTLGSLHSHLRHRYIPIEPRTCTVPNCKSETVFKQLNVYIGHLKSVRKLMTIKAQRPFSPPKQKTNRTQSLRYRSPVLECDWLTSTFCNSEILPAMLDTVCLNSESSAGVMANFNLTYKYVR
jgi:hypothetical protein